MGLPKTPSFRLDGKRALVAGASRGIGLGAAVALAEAGAEVVLLARSAEALDTLASALRADGHICETFAADVTDKAAVEAVFAACGQVDILCNSAGMARHAPALETKEEDFRAVMAINVEAAYFLAQAAARQMVGRGGSIIQISSQMGQVGGIERAVYSATKHAVEGMTKSMAIEWGSENIRVNTLCPTFVRTELTAATFADPEKRAWIESKIKLNRVAEVEDIMGAVVFLASEASAMVTGTSLLVDGGWTAG
ncbi:MAG: SDR family oxidoreductase [Pseudomonadota bacterium]